MKPWQIIRSLSGYSPWLFIGTGFGVFSTMYILTLLPGLVLQRFLDHLSHGEPAGANTWSLLGLLVAIGAVRMVTMTIASLEPVLHVWVGALLRRNMFAEILRHPGARAVPVSSGEAISRFRDDVNAITLFLSWTFDPIGQVLMLGIAIVILARIDPLLTIGVFVPLLLTVVLIVQAETRIVRFRKANQEAIGSVTGLIGEMFGAVQTVKAFGAGNDVIRHFREVNDQRRRATLNDRVFNTFLGTMASNLANIGVGVLLLLAAGKMRDGEFTVGDFTLFVSYLGGLSVASGFIGQYPHPMAAGPRFRGSVPCPNAECPANGPCGAPSHVLAGTSASPPTSPATTGATALPDRGGQAWLHLPGNGTWDRGRFFLDPGWLHDGDHRTHRFRQDHAGAGIAGTVASLRGRDSVERRAGGATCHVLRASAGLVHPTGATTLQRNPPPEHPARAARRPGGHAGCTSRRRAGTGCAHL